MLRLWVLLTNAKGRYSRGSSETLLDQDITTIKDGGSALDLILRFKSQVGRLDVTPQELEGRNQRSGLFKTMFLAFREAGARDWKSNLVISLGHSGSQHRLQFHHIFPKAVLKGAFTSRMADDIANLAFIGGKLNRQISDKAPAQYFPKLLENSSPESFQAQCIPVEKQFLGLDSYREFLSERRKLICSRLNQYLEVEQLVALAGMD